MVGVGRVMVNRVYSILAAFMIGYFLDIFIDDPYVLLPLCAVNGFVCGVIGAIGDRRENERRDGM